MENLLQLLNALYPLSPSLQDHLLNTIKSKTLRRREYLLKAGEICRYVSFIQTGLLRCYHMRGDKEVSRWFMREGDVVFSISSFYHQQPGFEFIQALEDCELFYITHAELEYIYHHYVEFNFIGRVLTIRYHKLWDDQIYLLQMQSAMDRYLWMLHNHPELLLRVPAKHIASWLDITEFTLSRIKVQAKNLSQSNFFEK